MFVTFDNAEYLTTRSNLGYSPPNVTSTVRGNLRAFCSHFALYLLNICWSETYFEQSYRSYFIHFLQVLQLLIYLYENCYAIFGRTFPNLYIQHSRTVFRTHSNFTENYRSFLFSIIIKRCSSHLDL